MAVIAIFIACCNNRIGELVAIRGLCLSVFALFEDAKKNHELSFPYFSPPLIPLLSLPENVRIPESIQISIIFERGNGRLLLEGRKAWSEINFEFVCCRTKARLNGSSSSRFHSVESCHDSFAFPRAETRDWQITK